MRVTKLQKTTDIGIGLILIIQKSDLRADCLAIFRFVVLSFDINYSMIPVTFKALIKALMLSAFQRITRRVR